MAHRRVHRPGRGHPIAALVLAWSAVGLSLAAAGSASASPGTARTAAPCVAPAPTVTARPASAADELVNRYGDTSGAWSGADSTYSTALPGARELFSFSDTFVGPVNADGSRPADTAFVNNSFVVADRSGLRTVIGGTAADPAAVVAPSDPDAWYWSGDPTTSGSQLQIPYLQFHRTGTGPFDFAWQRTVLARFDARSLHLLGVSPLPSATGVEWASYTLRIAGWTYVYGVEDLGSDKYAHVARVRGSDLRGTWQFWTGSGWSTDEADSARVLPGVANEYSVSRYGDGYVLITQDTSELLSPHIVAYFSCSPVGPFVHKTAVYTTPETGATGTYANANVYTYNAHAHPELSSGNRLLISYNVNSFDSADLYADASIYRPRFVVATLSDGTEQGSTR